MLSATEHASALVREIPFAAVAWFFSPWALLAGTASVMWILYRREFHSEVVDVLADDPAAPAA